MEQNRLQEGVTVEKIEVGALAPEMCYSDMWREGILKIHDSIFHYWMKQYDEGSQFGIEGGRISKLMLKRDGAITANYDRGWDIKPSDPDTQLALAILLQGENH